MQHRARFVFAAIATRPVASSIGEPSVLWMLMSPNNRPLGQSPHYQPSYADCQAAVAQLRSHHSELNPVCTVADRTGRWNWRVELGNQTVAVSSRSYLRLRECTYNLERFLAGVAVADVIDGTRSLRGPRESTDATNTAARVGPRPR